MRKKKTPGPATLQETELWLANMVITAPRPLPAGRFPQLLALAERRDGCRRDMLLDVLDLWLNYGYCRLIDSIAQDIALTDKGKAHFYQGS